MTAPCRPNVRLTLLARGDEGLYRALYGSLEVMASVGAVPSDAAIADQFERVLRHNASAHPGHRAWAIHAEAWPDAVGLAAFVREGDRGEFGMLLLPHAWRQGLSFAVIRTVLTHAFDAVGVDFMDVSRPDDGHVPVLDRMFAPFRFERRAGLRPGEVGWVLPRERWRAIAATMLGPDAPRARADEQHAPAIVLT